MSDTYTEQLRENYRELAEGTGESFESIAVRVESHGDKHTAAWLRSQAAAEAPQGAEQRTAAPRGRTAGNGAVKAAAADADADAAAEAAAKAAGEAQAKADADAAAAKAADAGKK